MAKVVRAGLLIAVTWLAAGTTAGGTAHAGDCVQVRFQFVNDHATRVRVRSVHIVGNDGTWIEDVGNRVINSGAAVLTAPRRLNRLDSGATGQFTVIYQLWDAGNAQWSNRSANSRSHTCRDEDRIELRMPG